MVQVKREKNGINYIVVTKSGVERRFMWNDADSLMDAASLVSSVVETNCIER